MNRILLIFLFCTAGLLAAGDKAVSFDRRLTKGAFFRAEVSLLSAREYQFDFSSDKQPLIRKEKIQITWFGSIKILEVNQVGNAAVIELKATSATGTINGKLFDANLLNGKRIRADLRKKPCIFTELDSGMQVSPQAQVFLSAIFRVQPDSGLQATFGPPRKLRKGMHWQPCLDQLFKAMKERGIQLEPSKLLASAYCGDSVVLDHKRCWQIRLNLETKNNTEPDCRLYAEIVIPENPKDGTVLKTTRQGKEVIHQILTSADPLSAGTAVRVTTEEHFSSLMLPAKEEIPSSKKTFRDMILR